MAVPMIAVAEDALMDLAEIRRDFQNWASFVIGSVSSTDDVTQLTKSANALIVSLQRMTSAHIAALESPVRVIGRAGGRARYNRP